MGNRGVRVDLTGKRFGQLVVLKPAHSSPTGYYFECKCDCGAIKNIRGPILTNGSIKSCGCGRRKQFARQGPTYLTWMHMRRKCAYPSQITICDSWQDYENFVKDMGQRPEGKNLERINFTGNFTPDNCTWLTVNERAKKKRQYEG